jgi:glycosyltransferase involved in cell wall biosynthesis
MMMHIGVDLTALLPRITGVDQYLLHIVRGLARIDARNRYTVFVNREDRKLFDGLPPNFAVRSASLRPRPLRLGFQQLVLPAAALALRLDVLHAPSFFLPLWRGRGKQLLSVHDMTSFTHPQLHTPLRRSRAYLAGVEASIRRADLVSVPSEFVADEVKRIVRSIGPERVRVVRYGIGEEFTPRASDEVAAVRERLHLPDRYILFVGTIQPRKDLDVVVEAYRRLVASGEDETHLVLAGQLGWGYRELLQRLAAPEFRERVHLPGYVSSDDLPALYAGAALFVYPSRVEGFGFPPLEAMATGTPVIASDTSSLAENLSGAAELVRVADAEAWFGALERLLDDVGLQERLRESGLRRAKEFTWERTARETLACYEELAA